MPSQKEIFINSFIEKKNFQNFFFQRIKGPTAKNSKGRKKRASNFEIIVMKSSSCLNFGS